MHDSFLNLFWRALVRRVSQAIDVGITLDVGASRSRTVSVSWFEAKQRLGCVSWITIEDRTSEQGESEQLYLEQATG
jgi:hypothetical protein